MKEAIRKFDAGKEFFTREGCHIIELANTPDDPQISIARARVEPGVTTQWHRLSETSERYIILEGEGIMEVGELPPTGVGPGDVVIIPPVMRQRIRNTGDCDLVFLAICSPRFVPSRYEAIGD